MFGLIPLISFAVVIGILVTIHELGHLIAARANGVFVESFSIGFGPKLFGFKDKVGTEWKVSLIPLGGYVLMYGDADASSVKEATAKDDAEEERMRKHSVHRKKPWQKIIISAGGPLANLIFAIVVLFSFTLIKGIPYVTPDIEVAENSYAYEIGLRAGDKITNVEGKDIIKFEEMRQAIQSHVGKTLNIEVKRGDELIPFSIDLFKNVDGKKEDIKVLGIAGKTVNYDSRVGIVESFTTSIQSVYNLAAGTIGAFIKLLTFKGNSSDVSGIISIFSLTKQSVEAGFASFIVMLYSLSTLLGAVNLLPIPVLDGGSIMISTIEWIIGKPLHKRIINTIFAIGLFLVVGLMLLGIFNDLVNMSFFKWMENLIR